MSHPDVGEVGRALWTKVDLFEKPTIAAINGHALGGGCELALACHFRYMADNPKAVMGCPEINLGITPGWGGTQRMTRLLGRTKALDLMLQAKRLSPKEALDIGLVERLFAPEQLMPQVMEIATSPFREGAAVGASHHPGLHHVLIQGDRRGAQGRGGREQGLRSLQGRHRGLYCIHAEEKTRIQG